MSEKAFSEKVLFIIFHGYGSKGDHLKEVCSAIGGSFENLIVLAPNAPFKSLNLEEGYEWFPITQVREDFFLEGLRSIAPYIKNYIELQVKEYNVNPKNVILAGFSQGACIAIHSGLRLNQKIKGIISFSGGLVDYHNSLEKEIQNKVPICLIHGENDRVIPAAFSERAKKTLEKNQVPCEIHLIENLDHYINLECVEVCKGFIKSLLD